MSGPVEIQAKDSVTSIDGPVRKTTYGLQVDASSSVRSDYRGLYPENLLDDTQASVAGTAAAVLTTTNLSAYGFPFRKLVFTKSAAVQACTLRCAFNGRGVGMFTVSLAGGETLAVTALLDGTNASDAICVRKTDGTFVAASALASGTYYIVTG